MNGLNIVSPIINGLPAYPVDTLPSARANNAFIPASGLNVVVLSVVAGAAGVPVVAPGVVTAGVVSVVSAGTASVVFVSDATTLSTL